MKEKSFVRHLNITFENDGTAHLNGRIEVALVDDSGAVVAIKPETFPVNAMLAADDAFAVAVSDRGLKAHIDALEQVHRAAEAAAEQAKKAADEAKRSAEAAAGQ